MDKTSEARLSKVHPVLAAKVKQMAVTLATEGIIIRVTQGLRTYQEQDALYAQGRTTPGNIVTNAIGGKSYHNYGLAVDVIPGVPNSNPWLPDWNINSPSYARMVEVGTKLGLYSGSKFVHLPDWPHFQMAGNMPVGAPTLEAQKALREHGLNKAWEVAGLGVPSENKDA